MYESGKKGLVNSIKAVLKRLELSLKAPVRRIAEYNKLKLTNYTLIFTHEGNQKIKLPRVPYFKILLGTGINVNRNINYASRPNAEVLLRKTIFDLYQSGYIDSSSSIVDIGCWISDNTLIWSQLLSEKGKVIAIDPSPDNIAYGMKLAELNGIHNVDFVQAVCAEKSGMRLDYVGSIDHATFNVSESREFIESDTIDNIVDSKAVAIGLLHVDVEGFELSVIRGAKQLIERDAPVITFEQHISEEKVSDVIEYLKAFDYKVFMINEVLPGCSLDCRNFLAFPARKGMPKLSTFEQSEGRKLGIYSAVIGDSLLEV